MYNSLIHKKPYGATAVGVETTFEFPLDPCYGIKRVFVILRREGKEELLRFELPYAYNKDGEDVFCGGVKLFESGIWHYRFEGELSSGALAFFGRDFDGTAVRGDWLPEWQLTVSDCAYKTPNDAKSGIIYHIFPDRFCKAEDRGFNKNGTLHSDWNDQPEYAKEGVDYRADDFFGGNVQGIISKLDYLKALGVTCIYLSPVFEASSNHRYDTGDYLTLDSLFGDEEQFEQLISLAKEKSISVMLDGVFNHTGADSRYFNKFGTYPTLGAYQSQDSPYYNWYYFFNFPDDYHCWWGSTCVPTVNKSAAGYRDLILGENGVIEKWTKLGVRGWRLDVVDELPVEFTSALCKKIKETDSSARIIGEVWEDASTKVSYGIWRPYFMGGQLDGVMNYPFKEAILAFVKDGDRAAFIRDVARILENYPKESLDCSMTLLGTHDTVRALTALGCAEVPATKCGRAEFRLSEDNLELAVKRLKLASLLQYTLPGVPCVFYGDEVGMQGFEDPLNRGTYPWGKENAELLAHYKKLGALRTNYAEYLTGETRFVSSDNALVFERTSKKGVLRVAVTAGGKAVVAVNNKHVFEL